MVIDNNGELAGVYRKLHLFDVDIPEFRFQESKLVRGGEYIVPPIETPIGRVGLQIVREYNIIISHFL